VSTYLDDDAAAIKSALDPGTEPPPNSDYLFVLYAVLMRAKGQDVSHSDVHDAWAAWMQLTAPEHDAIKPFSQLDQKVQLEDEPYVTAIRKVAMSRAKANQQY